MSVITSRGRSAGNGTPANLAKHVCISLAVGEATRWPSRTARGIEQFNMSARVTSDNGEVALRLALDGAGIVRLGDLLVGDPIRRGLLVPLLLDVHHAEPIALSAVYLAGRHRMPKVRVFLDFLIEQFARAPWRFDAVNG